MYEAQNALLKEESSLINECRILRFPDGCYHF